MTPRQYLCKMETDRREARRAKKGDIRAGETIECRICGYCAKSLSHHLKNLHGLTPGEYKSLYNVERVTAHDQGFVAGAANPAFDHGGVLSPWSKKNVHGYDAARHDAFKAAHSAHQTGNRKNVFSRAHYASDEEYIKAQTRDLTWFVGKYGECEGRRRHALKTWRWLTTLNAKSEEELNDINSKKVRKTACFYSKAEKEIFEILSRSFDDVGFAKSLLSPYTGRRYVYDMHRGRSIIEYDGDFWHMNPDMYPGDFMCPYRGITATEIWERDADKTRTAIAHGYTVLRIREQDYKKDKLGTIQKCKDFLNQ